MGNWSWFNHLCFFKTRSLAPSQGDFMCNIIKGASECSLLLTTWPLPNSQAYRCLHRLDPFVAAVARDQLCQVVVSRCYGLESSSSADLFNFLNSESNCWRIVLMSRACGLTCVNFWNLWDSPFLFWNRLSAGRQCLNLLFRSRIQNIFKLVLQSHFSSQYLH